MSLHDNGSLARLIQQINVLLNNVAIVVLLRVPRKFMQGEPHLIYFTTENEFFLKANAEQSIKRTYLLCGRFSLIKMCSEV